MATDSSDLDITLIDPESAAEMTRLINLDRFTTEAMGGPLVGLSDPSLLHNVLDVACGPGGWVLDAAFEHPEIEFVGVDISKIMITYAQARAAAQQLMNASFGIMDVTKPLDFPDASFDLVNARFLVGVLHKNEWEPFITECTRILRPGGILRLTEPVDLGDTSSPALEEWNTHIFKIIRLAGYGFSPTGRSYGIAPILARLLRNAGYQEIRHAAHAVEFSAGTPGWTDFFHQTEIAYHGGQSMLVKAGVATPEEAQRLYQQILIEIQSNDFCHIWNYLTVWGVKP
jgi:ubiquinone/menaquinone biosynthesis C-methylase UbiE